MKRHYWLAGLPTVGLLGGLPFVNRVHPFVLGLPFLLAWIVGWVVATAAIMALILVLDRREEVQSSRASRDAREDWDRSGGPPVTGPS